MNVVLVGNTGSGKTTVSRALTEHVALPLISSGAIAREMSESDAATDLALKAGNMAPEAAMRVAVRRQIEATELQHGGWILDGFPRTVAQLICLMQWTTALPLFVNLEVETWVCVERLTARARADDNPDAIARKLVSYQENTQPMLNILEDGGILHTVSARLDPQQVVGQIIQAMNTGTRG